MNIHIAEVLVGVGTRFLYNLVCMVSLLFAAWREILVIIAVSATARGVLHYVGLYLYG